MDHGGNTDSSCNYGDLKKQFPSPSSDEEYVRPHFLRNYALLCGVAFVHVFAAVFSLYATSEYAFFAIQKMNYPNVDLNKTTQSACFKNSSSKEHQIETDIQSKVSKWSVYISLATGIPALLATSTFASLSDFYGRKKFLILSISGTFIKNGLIAIGIYFKISVYWFILFSTIEGLTGSWIVTLAVSFAYIADYTSPGKLRTFYISAYEIVLMFSFTVGAILSGFYIKAVGFFYPVLTGTAVALLGIVILVFLPESLVEFSPSEGKNCKRIFFTMLDFFLSKQERNRVIYILCIFAFIFTMLASLGKTSIDIFFLMGEPFCLDAQDVSLYTTARGVLLQICGIAMIKGMQCCFRDEVISPVAAISAVAYFVLLGLAQNITMLILAPVAGAFSFPITPMIRSTLSKMTPVDKQGSIFAAVAFVENICSLVGAVITGSIYSSTVSLYRGFAYFVLAGFTTVAFILLVLVAMISKRRMKYMELSSVDIEDDSVATSSEIYS